MKVFNDRHFLRHISGAALREFTEKHVIGSRLNMDWSDMSESLAARICDQVQALEQCLSQPSTGDAMVCKRCGCAEPSSRRGVIR